MQNAQDFIVAPEASAHAMSLCLDPVALEASAELLAKAQTRLAELQVYHLYNC